MTESTKTSQVALVTGASRGIGAAIAQGRVGTAVKRPAGDELYRRCQYQLYGGVHKKLADTGHNPQRMQQHRQQQRQGQQRRQQQS